MKTLNEEIVEVLILERHRQRLSQVKLANAVYIHPGTLGSYEQGARLMSLENAEKLLNYVGYNLVIQKKENEND